MPQLDILLEPEDISAGVDRLAETISRDYTGKDLVLIGVLKGAFVFMSDLVRKLSISAKLDFVQVSSYGDGTESSGRIGLVKDIGIDIKGRHVIVVEDIVDTGITLLWLLEHIRSFEPADVRICTLLDKRERRQRDIKIDYAGFLVEKGFLVGYGLDYAEDYRGLPGVYNLIL